MTKGLSGNTRGILFMVATTLIFSVQDGITRHMTTHYPVQMVVMLRFWFIAVLMGGIAWRRGLLRGMLASGQKPLHIARGLLLVTQISLSGLAFAKIGLIESQALLTSYPLWVAALSGLVLGESVGWRRWSAIGVGFLGILVMLRPGVSVLSFWSVMPLFAALLFGLYALLTRLAARQDSAETSFLWTGIVGAVAMTFVGLPAWVNFQASDWGLMALLCLTSASGHWLMIRAYDAAEASAVQPFAYLQLVWIAILGVAFYGETLRSAVIVGSGLVVAAGLFTLWRQRVTGRG
ncbi:DMT family transporter [Rhodobacter sp. KR11]|uniref:DMT family transporter n=1 Tax=Rhodobacter sp. KR11 TaxID=2974588 RepID=UPI00222224CA|nr:DMT family transporter [Rhodobacter sp. KR11]MCW1919268.1 DMT family transporter [Rhodobacter sp. KR11]